MSGDETRDRGPAPQRAMGDVILSFVLSYGIAAFLIAALVYHAGVWNLLANTRLLDPLVEIGIIRYHDGNLGIVDGIPDQEKYVLSQDPIDWRLVLLAAGIYFLYYGLRGIKFHGVARVAGCKGTPGQHARAWLYGDGLARFFPFRFGDAAVEDCLARSGESPRAVRRALTLVEFLTLVFQILLFWLFGLLVTNYSVWFEQTFWALLICLAGYLVLRGSGSLPWGPEGPRRTLRGAYRVLAQRPGSFVRLGALAALIMLLDDLTPFVMAMAFTGDYVILNVPFFIIQSGVVAGYIARRFPITPLGIGQWEWAFALALYVSGVGFPEAATIALLDSFVRHGVGLLVFLVVTLWYGVPTTFAQVMRRYVGEGDPRAEVSPVIPAPPVPTTEGSHE